MYRSFAAVLLITFLGGVALADPSAAPPPGPPSEPAAEPSAPASTSDIFIYAAHGQSDKQLDRDRYECHNWAVAQSHYNPSDPHLAPHQQIQVVAAPPPAHNAIAGAVAGAVTGAILAGPYDTGRGAAIGAVAGGFLGATTDAAQQREATQINNQNAAAAQSERARLETQTSNYRRAISACLEGRGYTVK